MTPSESLRSETKLACDEIAAHPFWNTFQKYQRYVLAFGEPSNVAEETEAFFLREMQATWGRFQVEYPKALAKFAALALREASRAAEEERLREVIKAAVLAANTLNDNNSTNGSAA